MKQLQKFYPHALVLLGFVLISLIYFYPVLQGKKIFQSDIVQYTGMAKEKTILEKPKKLNHIGQIQPLEECRPINWVQNIRTITLE